MVRADDGTIKRSTHHLKYAAYEGNHTSQNPCSSSTKPYIYQMTIHNTPLLDTLIQPLSTLCNINPQNSTPSCPNQVPANPPVTIPENPPLPPVTWEDPIPPPISPRVLQETVSNEKDYPKSSTPINMSVTSDRNTEISKDLQNKDKVKTPLLCY